MLADDMSSKKNIKTPVNRDNTIEAVSNMCRQVSDLRKAFPATVESKYPNGIVLLSGVTHDGRLVEAIIDPPQKLQSFNYYNKSKFVLD
jgi:peptide subunit release factor 1 (eRF1)